MPDHPSHVVADLPVDRFYPAVRIFRAARVPIDISAAAAPDATWIAALVAFLRHYTAESDFVIGSIDGGRAVSAHVHVDDSTGVAALLAAIDAWTPEPATGEPLLFHAAFTSNAAEASEAFLSLSDIAVIRNDQRAELAYNAALFETSTAARMASHIANLFREIAAAPERLVDDLRILDDIERRQITIGWNDTAAADAEKGFLPEMFARIAARHPDAIAIIDGTRRMTYGELNDRANRMANFLRARGAGQRSRVGVCFDRSLEAVIAEMGILKAGAAVVLLEKEHPAARLQAVVRHSGTALVLTRDAFAPKFDGSACPVVSIDVAAAEIAACSNGDPEVLIVDDDPVIIPSTSGSTGDPKIVICRHGPLKNNIEWMRQDLGVTLGSRLIWLASAGYGITQIEWWPALALGATVCIAGADVAGAPERIRDFLVENRVTHPLIMTPIAVRIWSLPWPAGAALRIMIVTGERLRLWPSASLPYEVVNVYGSAEATLVASCRIMQTFRSLTPEQRENRLPPVGLPVRNVRLYVLDARLQPLPPGVFGDLYVAGRNLARGYADERLTSEKFIRAPLPEEPDAILYRTGDIARRIADGNVELSGRADDLVKIRGLRLELGEIETLLARHPSVREAIVVDRDMLSGDKRLVAYVVPDGDTPSTTQLRRALEERLPSYMIPSAFVFLERLPALTSGKIDRRALPPPPETRPALDVPFIAARGLVEEALAESWSRLAGIDTVGIDDSFFDIGGESLLAVEAVADLKRRFQIDVSLPELFAAPTIRAVARLVEQRLFEPPAVAGPTPARLTHDEEHRFDPFPLTDMQHALWVGRGSAVELGQTGCHGYFEWEGTRLDVERVRGAWQRLVERHDMLRAIVRADGLQQVLTHVPPCEVRTIDLRGDAAAEEKLLALREEMSHRILPADRWPLFEVAAVLLDDGATRLCIGIDLLIVDAWSLFHVVMSELVQLYENPACALPPLPVTFRDYLVTTRETLPDSEEYRRSREYWMERLASLPPAPDLPRRTPAPGTPLRFKAWTQRLSRDEWARFKSRAHAAGVTPSVALVAAAAEVFRTWSANERFTINFPIFDRAPLHPAINAIVGDFTNTLLVAVEKTDGTFAERAAAIQARMALDLQHRHFGGIAVLRELMQLHGGAIAAAMPIVVSSLVGQPSHTPSTAFGREVYAISQTPQVLLDFQIREIDGELRFNWDAIEALFAPGVLDAMFGAYGALLERLRDDPAAWQEPEFALLPSEQLARRAKINETDMPVREALLHELLFERAAATPDAPAVITPAREVTFAELAAAALAVGRDLRRRGVQRNELVAIVMEKGWEQYAAVYGILAAGAAYLPIDDTVPPSRLRYLLENGEVRWVLTQPALEASLLWPEFVERIQLDDCLASGDEPLGSVQQPGDLAYVIYTSGSTGQPKGVMVDHAAVVNLIADANRRLGITAGDRVLALAPLHFDLSIYDVFALIEGVTAVLPDPSPRPAPAHWQALMAKEKVTVWSSVPALLEIFLAHLESQSGARLDSLRVAVLCGDFIPLDLPDRLRALAPASVFSTGGPTETVCWSILYPIGPIDPSWISIPYGKPMANHHYFVLDGALRERPDWVAGEIYSSSTYGLAKGYWRDEELTRRRFVRHPLTGERMYASGDLGRWLPDGNIEILGRTDFQVKVQGLRIELGEIEAALHEHPHLDTAVAVAPKMPNARRRLSAFVVPRRDSVAPTEAELLSFLSARLPAWSVPSTLHIVDALPLTPNAKVDRLMLAARAERPGGIAAAEPARTAIEKVVAALAAELHDLPFVGREDNFFAIGGDSITVTQLAGRLHEMFGIEVPLRELFLRPTVAAVSEELLADAATKEMVLATADILAGLSVDEVVRASRPPQPAA